MARHIVRKNNKIAEVFSSADEAEKFAEENFHTKKDNGRLEGNLKDIFAENDYDFEPLKPITDAEGIPEDEILNVHLQNGQLVITTKDGNQKKI